MDPAILHIILTCFLGIIAGISGWFINGVLNHQKELDLAIRDLWSELNAHKLVDVNAITRLDTAYQEVARRLDSIEKKLDRLLEKS